MVRLRQSSGQAPYHAPAEVYDEAVDPSGLLRDESAGPLMAVAEGGPAELAARVNRRCGDAGVVFHSYGGDRSFVIDPVPRVIGAFEWTVLEAGLAQRARALNAFIDDVYGLRAAVADGVIERRVIDEAEHLDPGGRHLRPLGGIWIGVSGLDVVRGSDGAFAVLEDNVRTPSGLAYAMAARDFVTAELGGYDGGDPRPLDVGIELLRRALAAAAPPGAGDDPLAVLLSDGPHNSAWWEHEMLAGAVGLPLVTRGDLELRGNRLWLADDRSRPVDVVYRRTNAASSSSWVGRLLGEPLASGTLGVVNGFGTGVADDKLVHAHVENLVRYYLREEPLVPSVRTFDLGDDAARAEALERLPELVVKPRGGSGGVGVVICSHASAGELAAIRTAISERPQAFVAQETVMLSTHPTVIAGTLRPRHVDLRPFVFMTAEDTAEVLPGGLTRVAFEEGSLIVNSSQNGGAKDTWVLS